eukprot:Gb_29012 [translate_table: standard]
MSQQIVLFDAWLCEAEEANQLAEDIESRIRERDSVMAVGGDPYHIVSEARRKLMVLGTKLDRLESLLQNPPAKPILETVRTKTKTPKKQNTDIENATLSNS